MAWWQRVAAGLLGAMFLWAAGAKLRQRSNTEAEFAALGLGAPRALVAAVTGCELLTGIALLVAPRLGGFMSLGLLVAFSTVLVSVIVEGREVSCACFGAATSRPVDRVSLIRNLVLISVSLLVVVSVS